MPLSLWLRSAASTFAVLALVACAPASLESGPVEDPVEPVEPVDPEPDPDPDPDDVEPVPSKLASPGGTLFGMHDAPMDAAILDLFPKGGAFLVETRYATDFDWLADLGPRTSWARTNGFEPVVRLDYARPDGTTYADGTATHGATIPPMGEVGWCLARAGGGPSRNVGGKHLDCYLAYVGEAVSAAPDVHAWVIGNEMNMVLEAKGFPKGVIDPAWYAHVYREARARIRALPGHADDAVLVGAVAPGAKGGNAYEGGKDYLTRMLYALSPDEVDGIALHAYGGWVRPCDNGGVKALDAFEWGSKGGLGYRNQAQWIDALGFSRIPLLITEMSAHMHVTHGPGDPSCKDKEKHGNDAYLVDRAEHAAFVRDAYASLHAWNQVPGNHDIVGGVWFTYSDAGQFASESIRYLGDRIAAEGLGSSPNDNPYAALRELTTQGKYPHGNPADHGRCVESVGGPTYVPENSKQGLRGALRDSWKANGGVDVFGIPIEAASCKADSRGRVLHAQHTQRARLEYHPELAGTPYQVSFGLIGRALAAKNGVDPDAWSHSGAPHGKDCAFIGPSPDVGHYVCGRILQHWQSHGVADPSLDATSRSIRLFGYPISPPVTYDGRTVQWFERARLELHPNNPKPFDVLGGLLGCEASGIVGWGCP
jgi:hypothetical protein